VVLIAGAIACRMLEPGVCEMKRLYVRADFPGRGILPELANELIEDARERGYRTMLLDTLASMQSARALYRDLGFRPVEAHYDNPLPGVMYMALDLSASQRRFSQTTIQPRGPAAFLARHPFG
jgi:putative acetyltransferase